MIDPKGSLSISGRLQGPGVNPNSDGSTTLVTRESTKKIFEKHQRNIVYPKSLGEEDMKNPVKLQEKLDEVSMLKGIPVIKPDAVDRDLKKNK